jgi:putative membrane protein
MDILFKAGFLGTRAPLFMDIVSVIVLLLPFLILVAISLAKNERYGAHESVQKLLFFITVVVVAFFEIGVRMAGGYKNLMEGSSVGHNYFVYVLIFHIFIAVATLVVWIMTLLRAKRYKKERTLPGLNTNAHKKEGWRTFVGIVLTMLTGAWVYALLFVY